MTCRRGPHHRRSSSAPLPGPGRSVLAFLAAVALVACSDGVGRDQPSANLSVAIDLRTAHQVMDGFGVSERVWADPHLSGSPQTIVPPEAQDRVLNALFVDLKLTRLRAVLDPPRSPTEITLYSGKRADDHIALVKQGLDRGLRTFFAAPVGLEPWMRADPDRYVDWALAMLVRWRDLGAELPFFSPVNEPAAPLAADLPPDWLAEVVAKLGARAAALGLKTRMVIPDDLNPDAAYRRATVVLENSRSRPFVAALAYHLYSRGGAGAEGAERVEELAAHYKLPVWMTEYSADEYRDWPGALAWARTMHQLIAERNVSAVDYLWGFFGAQERPHALISLDMGNGRYRSLSMEHVYYLTGQFSRFVAPGCVRVEASSPLPVVLVSAFRCPSGELVAVVVNSGDSSKAVFSVGGGRLSGDLQVVRTGHRENGVTLPAVKAGPQGFSADLAAQTVTTFVGRAQP